MVRILEQTSFGWMIRDTDIGKIVFINYEGEEQIIKFQKGEEIPFGDSVMKDAVVFLANSEEFTGRAGHVESLDLVRYVLSDIRDSREVFTKRNSRVIAVPEILRIYRDVLESRVSKIGDNNFWELADVSENPSNLPFKPVTVHDLPPLRSALLQGLDTNF